MSNAQLDLQQQIRLCQQVAKLVKAKLPLVGELARAAEIERTAGADVSAVEEQLAAGKSLSAVLAGDRSRNSQILAACIEAGERSDSLDQTLEAWAGMYIANSKSAKAMWAAMVYPVLLMLVTLMSLGYVIWQLIPEYRTTYELYSHRLPWWLEWIVRLREQWGVVMIVMLATMLLPLIIWFWRRCTLDAARMPREPVQRLRLQALASNVAGWMIGGGVPLNQVVQLSTRVMDARDSDTRDAFARLISQRLVEPLPRELSMLLASLHSGVIDRAAAVTHMHAVAGHLQRTAERMAVRQTRWLPMLVALVVGGLTILTYVFLIYLPWIALLKKIVEPETF
ncbi:MAG: type II secretion system F family protein [Pirellulaceae bacterium]